MNSSHLSNNNRLANKCSLPFSVTYVHMVAPFVCTVYPSVTMVSQALFTLSSYNREHKTWTSAQQQNKSFFTIATTKNIKWAQLNKAVLPLFDDTGSYMHRQFAANLVDSYI